MPDARDYAEQRSAAWLQELERLAASAVGRERFDMLHRLVRLTSLNRVRLDVQGRMLHAHAQLPDLSHLDAAQLVAIAEGRFTDESLRSHTSPADALPAPVDAANAVIEASAVDAQAIEATPHKRERSKRSPRKADG